MGPFAFGAACGSHANAALCGQTAGTTGRPVTTKPFGALMPAVETMKPTTSDFAAMLEESFAGTAMMEGRVVPATVTAVANDFITVDVGLKTEGRIPTREFAADDVPPTVGAIVEVYLERIENALGDAVLSRDKAKREEAWTRLERLSEKKETVKGSIVGRVKGG